MVTFLLTQVDPVKQSTTDSCFLRTKPLVKLCFPRGSSRSFTSCFAPVSRMKVEHPAQSGHARSVILQTNRTNFVSTFIVSSSCRSVQNSLMIFLILQLFLRNATHSPKWAESYKKLHSLRLFITQIKKTWTLSSSVLNPRNKVHEKGDTMLRLISLKRPLGSSMHSFAQNREKQNQKVRMAAKSE